MDFAHLLSLDHRSYSTRRVCVNPPRLAGQVHRGDYRRLTAMSLWTEIHEQPGVLERALSVNPVHVEEVARSIEGRGCKYVVIAARGTSDNAARYAQYVWGARNRAPVALAAPSLFGPYQSPPSLDAALVVGISQSGESPDLIEVLTEARRQGRPTVAITNRPASPLANTADHVIDLGAGEENAVAATKTYTAQLMAVAMLSAAWAGDAKAWTQLRGLPGLMVEALKEAGAIEDCAAGLAHHERVVVVGRGFQQATAFEWALKLQELTYVLAQPFAEPDFRHGPVAVVEPGLPVLVVATHGAVAPSMVDLCRDLFERGATVVGLTDLVDLPAGRLLMVPETVEWLSPLVSIVAAQLFAFHLARARGIDPDSPRGLTKVTRTR